MRIIKTILCNALVILVLFSAFSGAAFAENTFKDNADFLQGYRAEENALQLYCSAIDGLIPETSSFSVALDNSEIPIVSVETTGQEAVTYYCLVDVSGSMDPSQLRVAKQSMLTICDQLNDGDKMVIAAMGDNVASSGFLTDTSEIEEAIDAIQRTSEDTNLYRAIIDSLQILNTSAEATFRKCLIIFSDGGDDSSAENGRTKQEAERVITETRIPVYSVFTPYGAKAAGKELGSLARGSAGGEAFYVTEQKLTEQEIGETIVNDMHGDLVLSLDLTEFEPKKDEMLLTVGYQTDEGTYGDTLKVFRSNLILVSPQPTNEPESEPEPVEDTTEEEAAKKVPLWLIITILCVLLAASALIIWKITHRPKPLPPHPLPIEENFPGTVTNFGLDRVNIAKKVIRFTTVGNNSFSVDLQLEEGRETTVGRNEKANVILNKDDRKLSSVHFVVVYKEDALRVWDAGSTNGTLVNDVPLKGNSIEMHDGDILGAGSYRYRLQFVNERPDKLDFGPEDYPYT